MIQTTTMVARLQERLCEARDKIEALEKALSTEQQKRVVARSLLVTSYIVLDEPVEAQDNGTYKPHMEAIDKFLNE